jgi:hypothetical protein
VNSGNQEATTTPNPVEKGIRSYFEKGIVAILNSYAFLALFGAFILSFVASVAVSCLTMTASP